MTSDNRGFMKPTYDEMMEEFYEDTQKKLNFFDELNDSSTLARGLPALTKEQTLTHAEQKELYCEELLEPSCLKAQNDNGDKVEEITTDEMIKQSTGRDDSAGFTLPQVRVSFKERRIVEVAKSTASGNVTRYRDRSSKKPFQGTHISSEAKSPKIKPKDISAIELDNLLMEAKSARDSSWYDVGTFLNHRASNGEIRVLGYLGKLTMLQMARVRFAGFDSSHDEWVSVERAIRQRSIPLQNSECHLVEVGDLVLCFRKTGDSDLYFDAHVMQIQRNLHDIQGCRCIFQVCYDHDNYEEKVGLSKLCRRPSG